MSSPHRYCENCKDMIGLLSKYDKSCPNNNSDSTITSNNNSSSSSSSSDDQDFLLEREDLNILFNYIDIWSIKHCACCYKDFQNFNRFDNLVQSVLETSFTLIKFIIHSCVHNHTNVSNSDHHLNNSSVDISVDSFSDSSSSFSSLSLTFFDNWSNDDKEKLLQLSSKLFQPGFPLYLMYKQRNEELTPKEIKILSNYCDLADFEMPIFLMRKIVYFIEEQGFSLYVRCFKEADPGISIANGQLPITYANSLISTVQNLKYYFNLSAINQELVSLRSNVINYLCKIQDNDLRNVNNRVMFEYIWSVVKEYNFNNFGIDRDGLKIALKYFTSSTLTMRLSGLAQINSYIGIYIDLPHSSLNPSIEQIREELNHWLLANKIIENIFGPNSHVEVIKQSHLILNFLTSEITTEHIDIIWSSAQLKHYERYIVEILCQLIKNLKIKIVYYIYSHLWKLQPKDHSEHTLNLASQVIKYIWFSSGIQPDMMTHCSNSSAAATAATYTMFMMNEKIKSATAAVNIFAGSGFDDVNVLNKNSFVTTLLKDHQRITKTNSSSGSSIEVSDEDEEEETAEDSPPPARPPVNINQTMISKQLQHLNDNKMNNIEDGSNSGSEFSDMDINNDKLYNDEPKQTHVVSDTSDLMDVQHQQMNEESFENITEKTLKESVDLLSLVWSVKNKNQDQNNASKMDVDLLNYGDNVNNQHDVKYQNNPAKTTESENFVSFRISDVAKPGNTLLWDILQDNMLNHLNEDIANAADKIFWNTICYASNQEIRLKFISGCLENLAKNSSVITSIRLLQKLFSSFNNYQDKKLLRKIIIDCEKQKNMLKLFFTNLSLYMSFFKESNLNGKPNPLKSKFLSPKEEIQIRLNFLNFIFIYIGSHENLFFSQEHVNIMWNVFTNSESPEIIDEFFNWLLNQVKVNNLLNIDIIKHILFEKMPLLKPESFSLISLELLQNLHGFILSKYCENPKTFNIVVKLLWDIAFKNPNQDVSMNASRHLNNYYINLLNCTNRFDKEDEFIRSCIGYLKDASVLLPISCNQSLSMIERAVLLLKTYLEAFYARYSYFFRMVKLSHSFDMSLHRLRVKNEPIIRVLVTSPFNDKNTFEFSVLDFIGDLRAEVQHWWQYLQKEKQVDYIEPIEKLICLVLNDHEISFDFDEKRLLELNFKDTQLNQISFHICKHTLTKASNNVPLSLSNEFFSEFKKKNPKNLLLETNNFELLFILMQQLDMINMSNLKARILSRNIWEIVQMLPTSPEILKKFQILHTKYSNEMTAIDSDLEVSPNLQQVSVADYEKLFKEIFSSNSNQKLIYTCQVVENYKKINQEFPAFLLSTGGMKFLYKLFIDVVGSVRMKRSDWTEWKQDCLASLMQILFQFNVVHSIKEDNMFPYNQNGKFDFEKNNCESNYVVMENKRKRMRKNSLEKSFILEFNPDFIEIINEDKEKLIDTLMTILNHVFINSKLIYQTSIWSRAQVVFVTLTFFTSWCYSTPTVLDMFFETKSIKDILKKLFLEDVDQMVRKESCSVFSRLFSSLPNEKCVIYLPKFLNLLLSFLEEASLINVERIANRFNITNNNNWNEEKESFGPGNKDYFQLVCRLMEHLFVQKLNIKNEINASILAKTVSKLIFNRENFELRKNSCEDEGLKGLFLLLSVVLKYNSHIKANPENKELIVKIFDCLFGLPTITQRELPKCKNKQTRKNAFDLLLELVNGNEANYIVLTELLINQHRHEVLGRTSAYPWEYWPHDESRSDFVGLTNLGATCYMASCMQHMFMLCEARNAILTTNLSSVMKHESILRELQKMFIFLQISERKTFNPKNFCKVYTMDHQPLNICEQKDMTEFFTDLITKLEEMTVDLKDMVKKHFSGLQSNNVVSLDCPHISQTMEEFYTLRCQVADMRDLYESLNELTVKDTLDGDNMYNCSECGRKVRAEKRACIKKLPKILCFNTMRYTFNMVTMTKEKVNTHFSFPFTLDMAPYLEKNLLNLPEDKRLKNEHLIEEESGTIYDLIGVTVHTGTAEGGHYYSFIQDRDPNSPTRNKWFFFNDAEVKLFDKTQIATECFGGEMTSKTYDKTNDKFMDMSFEKTNSAYMLFYEKCPNDSSNDNMALSPMVTSTANPSGSNGGGGGSSTPFENISKELIDWIWNDNISFIRDKLIFEHSYFDFVWRVCTQVPTTFPVRTVSTVTNKSALISTRLATLFVLETLIHAKEKPTIAQWIELLTKQFNNSIHACEWLIDHLSENDWWSIQILFKCSNQMVRQLFVRLCIHVIVKLRPSSSNSCIYLPSFNNANGPATSSTRLTNDDNGSRVELYSCVTRFIERLISLINVDSITNRLNTKYLNEYFSFLFEFAKQGDEECRFLLSIEAISTVINFYLNHCKNYSEFAESTLSDDNEDNDTDFDERSASAFRSMDEKFPKKPSLEKMIILIGFLIDKTQNGSSNMVLSKRDFDALCSKNNNISFQFIQQQILDNISIRQTVNLICSMCRLDETLFTPIMQMIFDSIDQFRDNYAPTFLKILTFMTESNLIGPYFAKSTLPKIWKLCERAPIPTLEWLVQQVPRNKMLHDHVLATLDHWVVYFLIDNDNQRVRSISGQLLISLVPSTDNSFRQNYRPFRSFPYAINKDILLNKDGMSIVDQLFAYLLGLVKKIKPYFDPHLQGTQKLTNYFFVLTYLMINTKQKRLFIAHFNDYWQQFQTKMCEPPIAIHENKQAFLMFWFVACQECKDSVKCIVQNTHVYKKIAFNYILADHEDQEVVLFNKNMLPYYYGLLRLCCEQSRMFTRYLATNQNIQWAFKNITPHVNQYLLAIQELFKLMKMFATVPDDATDSDLKEIANFKTTTFKLYLHGLDPGVYWGTIIWALKILIDSNDDMVFVIRNNGLCILFQSFSSLHIMFHQATACHITNELVDLLKIISSLLVCFEQHYDVLADCRANLKAVLDIKKMLFFLNSYTPASLRTALFDVLLQLLKLFPNEYLVCMVKFLHAQHIIFAEHNYPFLAGPYYPKPGQKSFQSKSSQRPTKPTFQMCFHVTNLQPLAERDKDYEQMLFEYYQPYYLFVEEMFRIAIKKGIVFDELIDLTIRLAQESLYFHNKNFIKLWLNVYLACEVQNNSRTMAEEGQQIFQNLFTYLHKSRMFADYLKMILNGEQAFLQDEQVAQFVTVFLDKVFNSNEIVDLVGKILHSMEDSFKKTNLKQKSVVEKLIRDLLSIKLIVQSRNPSGETIDKIRSNMNQLRKFYLDFLNNVKRKKSEHQFKKTNECSGSMEKIETKNKDNDQNIESIDYDEYDDEEEDEFLFDDNPYRIGQGQPARIGCLATMDDILKLINLIETLLNGI